MLFASYSGALGGAERLLIDWATALELDKFALMLEVNVLGVARTIEAVLPDGHPPMDVRAARTEVTIPLFPHMTDAEVEQVVAAIEEGLAR